MTITLVTTPHPNVILQCEETDANNLRWVLSILKDAVVLSSFHPNEIHEDASVGYNIERNDDKVLLLSCGWKEATWDYGENLDEKIKRMALSQGYQINFESKWFDDNFTVYVDSEVQEFKHQLSIGDHRYVLEYKKSHKRDQDELILDHYYQGNKTMSSLAWLSVKEIRGKELFVVPFMSESFEYLSQENREIIESIASGVGYTVTYCCV